MLKKHNSNLKGRKNNMKYVFKYHPSDIKSGQWLCKYKFICVLYTNYLSYTIPVSIDKVPHTSAVSYK